MWFSQTTPDEHPPTPPPCRCPALITLRTLTMFQLVWRCLCDVLFHSSCLFERTLTAVCAIPEYRSDRKYNIHTCCDHINVLNIFFRTCIVLISSWSSATARMPALSLVFFPCLRLTTRRHRQADGQLSPLYPLSPSFSSFGTAYMKLCCLPPPSLVRNIRLCCLV